MKKIFSLIKSLILASLFFGLFFISLSKNTIAQTSTTGECSDFEIISPPEQLYAGEFSEIQYQFRVADPNSNYKVIAKETGIYDACGKANLWNYCLKPNSSGIIDRTSATTLGGIIPTNSEFDITASQLLTKGTHTILVERHGSSGIYCTLTYTVLDSPPCKLEVTSSRRFSTSGFTSSDNIYVRGENVFSSTDPNFSNASFKSLFISGKEYSISVDSDKKIPLLDLGIFNPGNYTIKVGYKLAPKESVTYINCQADFFICSSSDPDCIGGQQKEEDKILDICGNKSDSSYSKCNGCIINNGSWTALGCIPSGSPEEFIKWLFPFVLGIAGGIATILMLIGGFLILTSTGDPKRVENGRNMLTSALMGLVLIVFSLFLLRVIGVDLLEIPGLK
jgi:hypothetical protein